MEDAQAIDVVEEAQAEMRQAADGPSNEADAVGGKPSRTRTSLGYV
jgi:hypothetical protein